MHTEVVNLLQVPVTWSLVATGLCVSLLPGLGHGGIEWREWFPSAGFQVGEKQHHSFLMGVRAHAWFLNMEICKHRVQHLLQPFTCVWLVFALRAAAECWGRMFKPVVLPAWLMERRCF